MQNSWKFCHQFINILLQMKLQPQKPQISSQPYLFEAHLERYEVLPTPGMSHSTSKVLHRTRRIERLVNNLRELKKQQLFLKEHKTNPGEFHSISRVYNKDLKSLNHSASSKSLWRHEKAFKSNPWTYSKKLRSHSSSSADPICTAKEIHLYISQISRKHPTSISYYLSR